jgi:hypothetical protein
VLTALVMGMNLATLGQLTNGGALRLKKSQAFRHAATAGRTRGILHLFLRRKNHG